MWCGVGFIRFPCLSLLLEGVLVPLIGAETLFGLTESYCLVWISGRFSVGKTSLGFLLARHFLERGYRLVTNSKSVWADSLESVSLLPEGYLKAVLLLDEGGLWLSSNQYAREMAAYAAKMKVVFLIPSFFPPASWFRVLRIQGMYTFRHIGIPVTFYRWVVASGAYSDSGTFVWAFPSRDGVYGTYSRQDPGDEPYAVLDWMRARVAEFRAYHGRGTSSFGPPLAADDMQGVEDAWARIGENLARRIGGRRRGIW